MTKYRIDRNNKYTGKVEIFNKKEVARGYFNNGKIKMFSVAMTLMLSMSSFVYAGNDYFSKEIDNTDYLYSYMEYDDELINVNLLNYKDTYKELEEKYNNMKDDEKARYVVSVFNGIIDGSDKFTDEEKEKIKNSESKFLMAYGQYYYFNNIFDMASRLRRVRIDRNVKLGINIEGTYLRKNNSIELDISSDADTLGHEVEHTMTIDDDNGEDHYAYSYIMEAMDSCTDLKYYSNDSYHDIMRTHMLFLSKVIGRNNLVKVYLNSDFELLKNLLAADNYDELMELFSKQHKFFFSKRSMNDSYCREIANKLKDMYEEKNKCMLADSNLMTTIYEASKVDSGVSMFTSLFHDNQGYLQKVKISCFDDDVLDSLKFCFADEENLNVIGPGNKALGASVKRYMHLKGKDNHIAVKKLYYFFPENVVKKITNSSNPKKYLRLYLKELGVSNADYWTYNILNDIFPVFCCEEGFCYDSSCFNKDLSIILKHKYQDLKKKDRLYELYDNFDVFYLNKNNVDVDRFRFFCNDVLNYDKDLSVDEIINNDNINLYHKKK